MQGLINITAWKPEACMHIYYTGDSLICEALISATYNLYICPCGIYSRLHTGAAGENAAEFTSTCEHDADTFPISSKPELQV